MTDQKDPRLNIKLSKATIDLLRNFSTINKSILIESGKFVQTMSVNKNIIAMGTIREQVPHDMAIYDLPLFLGAVSLFRNHGYSSLMTRKSSYMMRRVKVRQHSIIVTLV